MRDLYEVTVLRGVSHIVAPRDPARRLRLSEVELPLDPEVTEILAAHVEGGLHDAQAKAASFVVRGESSVASVCLNLGNTNPDLVERSQQLARALYSVVERDARVSDGTLAILLCEATNGSGTRVRFPALLKLDPSATLRAVTDLDPESKKQRVRYAVYTDSLPSKSERIQKCAFMQPTGTKAEYEMLVVDHQRRGEVVGTFWLRDFLGAQFVLDAPERTKRLYRQLQTARNEIEGELTAPTLTALDQVIQGAFAGSSVNLDDLLKEMVVPDAVRARIDAKVSEVLPDREFDLDPATRAGLLRRRTFSADYGLEVSARPEVIEQMLHVEDFEEASTGEKRRKIWFETKIWKEK